MVLMNGCLVSLSSQKHPIIDVSTTAAEITEAFYLLTYLLTYYSGELAI
jgi:hypothetical protein